MYTQSARTANGAAIQNHGAQSDRKQKMTKKTKAAMNHPRTGLTSGGAAFAASRVRLVPSVFVVALPRPNAA